MFEVDENEELVLKLFREQFGFAIEKIPKQTNKTADFVASCGDHRYLIEVKTRYRNDQEITARFSQIDVGGLAQFSRPILRSSDVSKLISKSLHQIEETAIDGVSFRIVLFILRDFGAEERWANILTNLYGIKSVCDWSNDGEQRECYYFSESDFYRYRHRLDGVVLVIAESGRAVLCLNDHSPRTARLRTSKLKGCFGDGVKDPPFEEANGDIWIADGKLDRKNERSVLARLREKYSLSEKTTAIEVIYNSAAIAISSRSQSE